MKHTWIVFTVLQFNTNKVNKERKMEIAVKRPLLVVMEISKFYCPNFAFQKAAFSHLKKCFPDVLRNGEVVPDISCNC